MRTRFFGAAILGLAVIGMAAGCDEPRKEKPWERITRLRLHYKVSPNFYENRKDKDGKPVLAQAVPMLKWHKPAYDDSVQWALVSFAADAPERACAPGSNSA